MSSRQVVEKILQRMDYPDPHPSDWNTPLSREQVIGSLMLVGERDRKGLRYQVI
jgi:hypothetical protein